MPFLRTGSCLLFLLCALGSSFARAEESIFLYELTYDGIRDTDRPEIRFAEGLKAIRDRDCLDTRRVGYGSSMGVGKLTQGLLRRTPLTQEQMTVLHQSVCAPNLSFEAPTRSGLWQLLAGELAYAGLRRKGSAAEWKSISKDCRFTFKMQKVPLRQLRINGQDLPAKFRRLPRLSEACKTGEYADSWNGGFTNPEGRAYADKFSAWAKGQRRPSPFVYQNWITFSWGKDTAQSWTLGNGLIEPEPGARAAPEDAVQ